MSCVEVSEQCPAYIFSIHSFYCHSCNIYYSVSLPLWDRDSCYIKCSRYRADCRQLIRSHHTLLTSSSHHVWHINRCWTCWKCCSVAPQMTGKVDGLWTKKTSLQPVLKTTHTQLLWSGTLAGMKKKIKSRFMGRKKEARGNCEFSLFPRIWGVSDRLIMPWDTAVSIPSCTAEKHTAYQAPWGS